MTEHSALAGKNLTVEVADHTACFSALQLHVRFQAFAFEFLSLALDGSLLVTAFIVADLALTVVADGP